MQETRSYPYLARAGDLVVLVSPPGRSRPRVYRSDSVGTGRDYDRVIELDPGTRGIVIEQFLTSCLVKLLDGDEVWTATGMSRAVPILGKDEVT